MPLIEKWLVLSKKMILHILTHEWAASENADTVGTVAKLLERCLPQGFYP